MDPDNLFSAGYQPPKTSPNLNSPPSNSPDHPVPTPPANAPSVNLPQTPASTTNPQAPPLPPSPIPTPTSPIASEKFPQSTYPYSNQTIAQDLTESNVIGKAVTVTVDNLSVREKIPLMKISLLLIFIITAFSGSFLYFRFTSASPVRKTAMITKPAGNASDNLPVSVASPSALPVNPFASPTGSFVNPFAPTSTPSYQNPFGETTVNETGDNQTYQNPFENLK